MQERKRVVIIGGGITGLTAAYYLTKQSHNIDVTLIEATDRLGGKIDTLKKDGFTIERGPDSFLERKVDAKQLVQDLGLDDELVRNATGQAFILSQDRLHPIPKGSKMGIPLEWKPFLRSSLFSIRGKVAAFNDLIIGRSEENGDQSVGHFFRRRLGNQVVDRLIHPLISGIYAGDIDYLSLNATFPHFKEVEANHKSLIKGLRESDNQTNKKNQQGQFMTLKSGLQTIVNQIKAELPQESINLNQRVTHIEKKNDSYTVHIEHQNEPIEADDIIMTTPHRVTEKIFSQYDFIHDFSDAKSTSVANVALAFEKDAIDIFLMGQGLWYLEKSNIELQLVLGLIKMASYNTRRTHSSSSVCRKTW